MARKFLSSVSFIPFMVLWARQAAERVRLADIIHRTDPEEVPFSALYGDEPWDDESFTYGT
jgi:hypothetical protein